MEDYVRHVAKFLYRDGIRLQLPDVWCGEVVACNDWLFQSAEHALLSILNGDRLVPCEECLKALARVIESELNDRADQQ